MKAKKNSITLTLAILMFSYGFGQSIAGSAHDFSGDGWNPNGEICQVCHTPHGAISGLVAPLWNHEVSTATYQLYTNLISPSFDGTTTQPDGSSKLCLSCHDGTVALDNFDGATGGSQFISGGELIGTDLTTEHPISFVYDAALATTDGDLYDPTTQTSGLGGTIDGDMLLAQKLQCSSCHDVHNGSGAASLLVMSNAGSALCLTCHNK